MSDPVINPVSPSQPSPSWFSKNYRSIYSKTVWVIFFGILYILSNFLSLLFLTFILSYTINSLVKALAARVTWPRWAVVITVFVVLLMVMTAMGMVVVPKVYQEGKDLSLEIPEAKDKVIASIKGILQDDSWGTVLKGAGIEEGFQDFFTGVLQNVSSFMQKIFRTSFHFILSLIFSFLILWDLDRLILEVQGLKGSRLGKPFRIVGPKIAQFGDIVGRAFEAQIVIAFVNTILTLTGLTFLGIPNKLFLSVFVFVCSFIPVVGVILSSVPLCLIGYKTGGIMLAIQAGMLIAIIHFIEAYFLNPRIVGSHLSVHPFIAVCILVFSENWFGVWGLLLGVPCAIFIYRSLINPAKKNLKTGMAAFVAATHPVPATPTTVPVPPSSSSSPSPSPSPPPSPASSPSPSPSS